MTNRVTISNHNTGVNWTPSYKNMAPRLNMGRVGRTYPDRKNGHKLHASLLYTQLNSSE